MRLELGARFDAFAAAGTEIEAAFGQPLEWQRLEGKRGCRIKTQINLGGYHDEEQWPTAQEAMIDAMMRLEQALRPHIAKLQYNDW